MTPASRSPAGLVPVPVLRRRGLQAAQGFARRRLARFGRAGSPWLRLGLAHRRLPPAGREPGAERRERILTIVRHVLTRLSLTVRVDRYDRRPAHAVAAAVSAAGQHGQPVVPLALSPAALRAPGAGASAGRPVDALRSASSPPHPSAGLRPAGDAAHSRIPSGFPAVTTFRRRPAEAAPSAPAPPRSRIPEMRLSLRRLLPAATAVGLRGTYRPARAPADTARSQPRTGPAPDLHLPRTPGAAGAPAATPVPTTISTRPTSPVNAPRLDPAEFRPAHIAERLARPRRLALARPAGLRVPMRQAASDVQQPRPAFAATPVRLRSSFARATPAPSLPRPVSPHTYPPVERVLRRPAAAAKQGPAPPEPRAALAPAPDRTATGRANARQDSSTGAASLRGPADEPARLDPAAVRRAFEQIPAPDLSRIADRLMTQIERRQRIERERSGWG